MDPFQSQIDSGRQSPSLSDVVTELPRFGHDLGMTEEVKLKDQWRDFMNVAANGHISDVDAKKVRFISDLSTVKSFSIAWIGRQLMNRKRIEEDGEAARDMPFCKLLQALSIPLDKKLESSDDPKDLTLLQRIISIMSDTAAGELKPAASYYGLSSKKIQQASFVSYVQFLQEAREDYKHYVLCKEINENLSGDIDGDKLTHVNKKSYFHGRMIALYNIQDDISDFLEKRKPLKISTHELKMIMKGLPGHKEVYERVTADPQIITQQEIRDLRIVLTKMSRKIMRVENRFAMVRSVPVIMKEYLARQKIKREKERVAADNAIAEEQQRLASQVMHLRSYKQREIGKDLIGKNDELQIIKKRLDAAASRRGLSLKFEKEYRRRVDDIVAMRKTCIYVLKLIFTLGLLAFAVGRDLKRYRANVSSAKSSIKNSETKIRVLRTQIDIRNEELNGLRAALDKLEEESEGTSGSTSGYTSDQS